jgi:uncharacterized zinc-type alcohol dehydrogenase-like protein
MFSCTGYAAPSAKEPVVPFHFERRDPGADDVEIKILYCGVCHSDLHQVRNEWGNTVYPCVPGHEIIGTVTRVGGAVTTFKPGDIAGIGCMVDACRECENCRKGLEQFCKPGFIATYKSPDPHTKRQTFGGYSSHIVVDRHFALCCRCQLAQPWLRETAVQARPLGQGSDILNGKAPSFLCFVFFGLKLKSTSFRTMSWTDAKN